MTGYSHSYLLPLLAAEQRKEPWANGAGTTTVILREPDSDDWRIRVSVARVDQEGPFSELANTRRILVPLDAPIGLRFPDSRELHAARLGILRFEGSPAPVGLLPEGPTRDFNLMLRDGAEGKVMPRTLVDSMLLTHKPGMRWLVYVDSGGASIHADGEPPLTLGQRDAALVTPGDDGAAARLEGAGEIVLVALFTPGHAVHAT